MGDTRVGNMRLDTPDSCHEDSMKEQMSELLQDIKFRDNFPIVSQYITKVLRVLCGYILCSSGD